MKQIAQILLFDRNHRLIIYLRDDKPEIPFPNHWDLIGGHVEEGETPEQALVRETKEEIGVELKHWRFFRRYECSTGDAYPNTKFIYHAEIDRLRRGAAALRGPAVDRHRAGRNDSTFSFANILGTILEDFIAAGGLARACG